MKIIKMSLVICSIFFIAACQKKMTATECLNTNWYQMGNNDAATGHHPRNLERNITDCAKHGIAVDTNAYQKGWRDGLKQYCIPSYQLGVDQGRQGVDTSAVRGRIQICQQYGNQLQLAEFLRGHRKGLANFCTYDIGLTIGIDGKHLPAICPSEIRGEFIRGWQAGNRRYCSNENNAFSLGRDGKAYPTVCSDAHFPNYRRAYERGRVVAQRIHGLERQIADVDRNIHRLVRDYDLRRYGASYRLGENHSWEAREALKDVREHQRHKDRLEHDLFEARTRF